MPAQDRYATHSGAAGGSARRLRSISPHDTDELEFVTNAIVCAVGGVISVVAVDDDLAVTVPVVAGQIYPLRAKAIRDTGTTASGIVALIS